MSIFTPFLKIFRSAPAAPKPELLNQPNPQIKILIFPVLIPESKFHKTKPKRGRPPLCLICKNKLSHNHHKICPTCIKNKLAKCPKCKTWDLYDSPRFNVQKSCITLCTTCKNLKPATKPINSIFTETEELNDFKKIEEQNNNDILESKKLIQKILKRKTRTIHNPFIPQQKHKQIIRHNYYLKNKDKELAYSKNYRLTHGPERLCPSCNKTFQYWDNTIICPACKEQKKVICRKCKTIDFYDSPTFATKTTKTRLCLKCKISTKTVLKRKPGRPTYK